MSVDATSQESLEQGLSAIAASLEIKVHSNMADAVCLWLKTHQEWLLVFDNVAQDINLTRYYPNNPQGLVFIVSHHRLDPPDAGLRQVSVDVMSATEARDYFCNELQSLARSKEQFRSCRSKIEEFVQLLGFYPLIIKLGSAWIMNHISEHEDLSIGLVRFVEDYREYGRSTDFGDEHFTTLKMLVQPLISRSMSPDDTEAQDAVEILKFFSVLDHSGLPEHMIEICWLNMKRKRDQASEWTKNKQMKFLQKSYEAPWRLHPWHTSVEILSRTSLINWRAPSSSVDKRKRWISMHPAIQRRVRQMIFTKDEDLFDACWSAIVTVTAMTSLSSSINLKSSLNKPSLNMEFKRIRQQIHSHMDHCFRLYPGLRSQIDSPGDGLLERMEMIRIYTKAYSEDGMVKEALRLQLRAIQVLEMNTVNEARGKRTLLNMRIEQATNLVSLGHHREALELREKLHHEVTHAESAGFYEWDLIRTCKINLARSYERDRQPLKAFRLIEEIEVASDPLEPDRRQLDASERQLEATILYSLESRRPEALHIRQEMVRIDGPEDVDATFFDNNKKDWTFSEIGMLLDLGNSYFDAGWLLLARRIREFVLEEKKQWYLHVPEHQDVLWAQYNLAHSLQSLGESKNALAWFQKTEEASVNVLSKNHELSFKVRFSQAMMRIEVSIKKPERVFIFKSVSLLTFKSGCGHH